MFKSFPKLAILTAAVAFFGAGVLPTQAKAQTLNSVLSTVASIGQQILFGNYQNAKQPANSVVGYTQNGGTLYGDGRIVMPNGQTFWPNANGRYTTGQYVYYSPKADPHTYTYDYKRTGQFDRTHRHGKGHAYAYGHNTPPGANPRRGGNEQAENDKHGKGKHGDGNDNRGGEKH